MRSLIRVLMCTIVFSWKVLASPGVSYQGRIIKPDGSPLEGSAVQFRMQVRSPGSENCLLYEEVKSIDMSGSSGVFSITVNDGNGTRLDTPTYQIDQVFSNASQFILDSSRCVSGSSYTPGTSDGRKFIVYFKDETMSAYEPLPIMDLNYIPQAMYALEAQKLDKFSASHLLRAVDGSGNPAVAPALDPTQLTNLLSLLAGTSTQYATTTQFSSIQSFAKSAPPTCGAGEVLRSNGTTLSCVTDSAGGAPAYSAITGATGINTIDNTNFAQTWNWSTATTQSPMSMSANALTTGSAMSVSTSSASLNSTNGLLNIANTGSSTSGILARFQSNSTAGSGLTVLTNGNVGIGTTSPTSSLAIASNIPNSANGAAALVTGTSTADINSTSGLRVTPTFSPTTSASNTHNAIYGSAIIGNTNLATGTNIIGVAGNVYNAVGTTTGTATAGQFTISNTATGGSLNSATGLKVALVNSNSSATIGTARGIFIDTPSNSGTFSSTHGIYISSQNNGVQTNTPFGIYQSGASDLNYFAGNVGVGTAAPSAKLHVQYNGVVSSIFDSQCDGCDGRAVILNRGANSTGSRAVLRFDIGAYGNLAGQVLAVGEGSANAGLRFDTSIGGGSNTAMSIKSNGNVGIGTTSPQTKFQVEGVISPATNNSYSLGSSSYRFTEVFATNGMINTSDFREKKDIEISDLGLNFINKLRPVSYRWNNGVDSDIHYGLIAQEVKQTLSKFKASEKTSIVTYDEVIDRYGVRYSELISPLIKATQDLYSIYTEAQEIIAIFKRKLASNENEITLIKGEILQKTIEVEKLKMKNAELSSEVISMRNRIDKIENTIRQK